MSAASDHGDFTASGDQDSENVLVQAEGEPDDDIAEDESSTDPAPDRYVPLTGHGAQIKSVERSLLQGKHPQSAQRNTRSQNNNYILFGVRAKGSGDLLAGSKDPRADDKLSSSPARAELTAPPTAPAAPPPPLSPIHSPGTLAPPRLGGSRGTSPLMSSATRGSHGPSPNPRLAHMTSPSPASAPTSPLVLRNHVSAAAAATSFEERVSPTSPDKKTRPRSLADLSPSSRSASLDALERSPRSPTAARKSNLRGDPDLLSRFTSVSARVKAAASPSSMRHRDSIAEIEQQLKMNGKMDPDTSDAEVDRPHLEYILGTKKVVKRIPSHLGLGDISQETKTKLLQQAQLTTPDPDARTHEAFRKYFELFGFDGHDRISGEAVREHMRESAAGFTDEELQILWGNEIPHDWLSFENFKDLCMLHGLESIPHLDSTQPPVRSQTQRRRDNHHHQRTNSDPSLSTVVGLGSLAMTVEIQL
eukprot:m.70287 g.70287  ORF g.70287 m.70287 type:complete len:476 (+) comp7585_c0_seq1:128-1555(+)